MTTAGRWGRRVAVASLVCAGVAACTVSVAPSALDQGARPVDPGALAASTCRAVDPGDVRDRDHLDPAAAPPPEELYATDLPAAGPHLARWSPPIDALPPAPMDVRALLHNLEHGAIVVWVDPAQVDEGTRDFIEQWRGQLGAAGFDNEETGAAVFVSRMPGHVGPDVAAVALRAWGVALDCTTWDLAVADAFVGVHYGTRGTAPEAELGPWPSGNGVLVGPPDEEDTATATV